MLKKIGLLLIGFILLLPGWAVSAENDLLNQGYIEGYLLEMNRGSEDGQVKVVIETYDGNSYKLDASPQAVFTIDNVPVTSADFRAGMEIYGKIQEGVIVSLESYSTAVPGYISPGSRMVTGIVKEIDDQQIILRLPDGKEALYYISPATLVMKEGSTVPLDVLYEGDRVKLYFDEIDSNVISQLKIEGDSILVRDLYKGQLRGVDTLDKKVILQNVQVFKNGKWQDFQPILQVPYIYELSLCVNGQKIPQHRIKYYQGNTVYLVSRNFMGLQVVDKMAVKTYYEVAFSDKIEDINWFNREFETENRINLAFNSGSIVIKNGRLQDEYSLSSGDNAYIIADAWGSKRTANIIYVYNQDINNSSIGQHNMYAGRIEQILQDRIWLDDYSVLDDNEWDSSSKEKELFYDSDTRIYDLEAGRFIDSKEFYAGDYAVEEGSRWARYKDLEDYYAYVYANGDRAVSITLLKDIGDLNQQRVSNGIFDSIEYDPLVGWVVSLRDSCDWSNYKEKWLPRARNLQLGLEKAMIVKNDRIITPEELEAGDRLYIVRDDYRAVVVIVK